MLFPYTSIQIQYTNHEYLAEIVTMTVKNQGRQGFKFQDTRFVVKRISVIEINRYSCDTKL